MDILNRSLSDFEYFINETDSTTEEPEFPESSHINDFGQRTFFEPVASEWIQFTFVGVLLTPVAVFGVLGNILSILVLSQKQMRSSLSVLLIGLSLCDVFVCLASILVFGLPSLFKHFYVGSSFLDLMCIAKKIIFPIAVTAQTGSAYFTVAVTFERYVAVCRPLQARSICTWERARTLTVAIILFSIFSNIPRYISYATKEEVLHANHTCESSPSKNSKSTGFISVIIYTIFQYLLPICTVSIVNCVIIWKIRQQNTKRDTLSRHQLTEIKLTNMLIAVVTVYVVCNFFRLFNTFTKITFGYVYAELAALTNFLVTFNSAVDFIIYCAFGRTFRETSYSLFCKCNKWTCSGRRGLSRHDKFQITIPSRRKNESVSSESVLVTNLRRFSSEFVNFVRLSRPPSQDHSNSSHP